MMLYHIVLVALLHVLPLPGARLPRRGAESSKHICRSYIVRYASRFLGICIYCFLLFVSCVYFVIIVFLCADAGADAAAPQGGGVETYPSCESLDKS